MVSLVSSRQWWLGLPGSTRLYLVGLFCIALLFVLAIVHAHAPTLVTVGYAAMLCLGTALLREAYLWLISKREWLPTKLIGGALTIMAAAVATSSAAFTISEATGQDPASFTYSVAFFAPIAFIPILALLVIALSIIALPIIMLLSMGGQILSTKIADLDVLLLVARVCGILSLLGGASQLLNSSTGLDVALKKIAANSAYHLDLHRDLLCSRVPSDRVLRLNDQIVVVGRITDAGPRFVRRPCPLAVEPTELPPPAKLPPQKDG